MTELAANTLALLLDTAPDALVAVDEAGAIVLVNVQAERLLGYRGDLVGRPIELIVPDARISSTEGVGGCVAGAKGGLPIAGEQMAARRTDGGDFPAEISAAANDSDSGLLISMAIRDATERANAEAEREGVKVEADRVRLKAERERSEAEHVRVEVERVRLEAGRDLVRADSVLDVARHGDADEVVLAYIGALADPDADADLRHLAAVALRRHSPGLPDCMTPVTASSAA